MYYLVRKNDLDFILEKRNNAISIGIIMSSVKAFMNGFICF